MTSQRLSDERIADLAEMLTWPAPIAKDRADTIDALKELLRYRKGAVEPREDQPCPQRADGHHDFRHEVCDCGAYRGGRDSENRGAPT